MSAEDDDFGDGWDDDEDLDFDDSETGGDGSEPPAASAEEATVPVASARTTPRTPPPYPLAPSMNDGDAQEVPNGWDNDDDLEGLDESVHQVEATPKISNVHHSTYHEPKDSDKAELMMETLPPQVDVSTTTIPTARSVTLQRASHVPPPPAPALAPQPPSVLSTDIQAEGWDDDNLLFDDSEQPGSEKAVPQQRMAASVKKASPVQQEIQAEGWDDDDDVNFDDFEDADEVESPSFPAPTAAPFKVPEPPASKLYQDLEDYVIQLPRLLHSINAILEYECNTQSKARELMQYYAERPGLTTYTIEKELPRMDYTLVLDTATELVDKAEIARRLVHEPIVSRCANQSLLADLLHVVSGADLLVRPQFMSTAIAQECRFRLEREKVNVEALLDLSLPMEHERWKIAELAVSICFWANESEPFVQYRLENIWPTTSRDDASWASNVRSVAEMLSHLHPEEHGISPPGSNFRDVFLQQSQSLLANSTDGMKSAWQEVESVAGFGNKLRSLPAFLPDDVVQAAQQEPVSPPKQRPASVWGGLFGKLAQTVTLPDEDPSIYQEYQQPSQPERPQQAPIPHLYNVASPPPAAPRPEPPHLYRKETPLQEPPSQSESPRRGPAPQLYQKEAATRTDDGAPQLYRQTPGPRPPPGPPPAAQAAAVPASRTPAPPPPSKPAMASVTLASKADHDIEPVVEDGWDDDLNIQDDEDEMFPEETSPIKAIQPSSSEDRSIPTTDFVPADWMYDPSTDIIPTRKRWVNPVPGSRQLSSFVLPQQQVK